MAGHGRGEQRSAFRTVNRDGAFVADRRTRQRAQRRTGRRRDAAVHLEAVGVELGAHRDDRLERRRRGRGRLHLAAACRRAAPHADAAVAPRLLREPLGHVVGVEARGVEPLAAVVGAVLPERRVDAAEIDDRNVIPVLDEPKREAGIGLRRLRRRDRSGGCTGVCIHTTGSFSVETTPLLVGWNRSTASLVPSRTAT